MWGGEVWNKELALFLICFHFCLYPALVKKKMKHVRISVCPYGLSGGSHDQLVLWGLDGICFKQGIFNTRSEVKTGSCHSELVLVPWDVRGWQVKESTRLLGKIPGSHSHSWELTFRWDVWVYRGLLNAAWMSSVSACEGQDVPWWPCTARLLCVPRTLFLVMFVCFVFFTVAPNAAYFSLSFELSWVTFSVSPCCIVKMFLSYLKWSEGLLSNYSTFIAREICSWNGQTLTVLPGWFSLYLFPVFFLGSPLVSAQSSPVGSQKESLASCHH